MATTTSLCSFSAAQHWVHGHMQPTLTNQCPSIAAWHSPSGALQVSLYHLTHARLTQPHPEAFHTPGERPARNHSTLNLQHDNRTELSSTQLMQWGLWCAWRAAAVSRLALNIFWLGCARWWWIWCCSRCEARACHHPVLAFDEHQVCSQGLLGRC